jgi:hypothetical protein
MRMTQTYQSCNRTLPEIMVDGKGARLEDIGMQFMPLLHVMRKVHENCLDNIEFIFVSLVRTVSRKER